MLDSFKLVLWEQVFIGTINWILLCWRIVTEDAWTKAFWYQFKWVLYIIPNLREKIREWIIATIIWSELLIEEAVSPERYKYDEWDFLSDEEKEEKLKYKRKWEKFKQQFAKVQSVVLSSFEQ